MKLKVFFGNLHSYQERMTSPAAKKMRMEEAAITTNNLASSNGFDDDEEVMVIAMLRMMHIVQGSPLQKPDC